MKKMHCKTLCPWEAKPKVSGSCVVKDVKGGRSVQQVSQVVLGSWRFRLGSGMLGGWPAIAKPNSV